MYAGVCMPLLQVRDCPEDVYQKITLVARREKRTIAQQVIVLLENSLGQEQSNLERRQKLMEKINRRSISDEVKKIDVVALIREDRDR
jgi:predicted nuclease of restriction endonuclease-like RecB superfamily